MSEQRSHILAVVVLLTLGACSEGVRSAVPRASMSPEIASPTASISLEVASPAASVAPKSAGCGNAGSETDLSKDPDYVSYVRWWSNDEGCRVRRDIIAMRESNGECYPLGIREILMGTPLGEPTTPTTTRIFVRDPDGPANYDFGKAPLIRNAKLPADAQMSRYRYGDLVLWVSPSDNAYVYLAGPDETEAWPREGNVYGCV